MGRPQRKREKFWQIEKKIIDLYELDNFKQKFKKNFKIEIANVIFRTIFYKSENVFVSIAQIKRGFQKLGHLVTKSICLKIFESSR